MNNLDRLEKLAQRLIEGTFHRLFQTELHPANLAHQLALMLEKEAENGSQLQGQTYRIMLNPANYEQVVRATGDRDKAAEAIQQELLHLVQERGYPLAGPFRILLEQRESLASGQVEIEPSYGGRSYPPRPTGVTKPTGTPTPPGTATNWQLHLGERQIRLGEPVIRIGRALDNDIILVDPTVSRYHAHLRWRGGRYYLYPPAPPANSTTRPEIGHTQQIKYSNVSTTVNQKPILQTPLRSGDVLKFGTTILTVTVV